MVRVAFPPEPMPFATNSELKRAPSCPKRSGPDTKDLKTPGIGIELGINALGEIYSLLMAESPKKTNDVTIGS
jgi:hypothetical protein